MTVCASLAGSAYGRSKRPARNLIRSTRRTASSMAAIGSVPSLDEPRCRASTYDRLTISMSTPATSAMPRRVGLVGRDAVLDQLDDRRVVAHDDAVEPPLARAAPVVRRERVAGRGHAAEVVERAHDGADAGVDARP